MPRRRSIPRALTLSALAVVATSCAVGDRPTLAEVAVVDDDAADAVLDRLDRPPSFPFAATYEIPPSSGLVTTEASISRDDDGTIVTQIGQIAYTTTADGTTTTCDLTDNSCDDYANDARVSDLAVTHQFWGTAFRQRLTTDSGRRIGPSTGSVTTIAGAPATCVDVKVPSSIEAVGTVNYCAIDAGVLGRYFGADVVIELTSFARIADPLDS